jgi:hypothetical protein
MIDKLSVFHGVNGQHAGTLEIRETKKSGASPLYEWAWHGGWAGSQNGIATWDDKAKRPRPHAFKCKYIGTSG